MNKTLWNLQITGERLWLLANMTAQQAAALDMEGRDLAIVADETRSLANKVNRLVELALFEDEEIKPDSVRDVARMLNLLALNNAIASHHKGVRGKPAAVCADDIRDLAYKLTTLFDENKDMSRDYGAVPVPKQRISSVDKPNDFMRIDIGGVSVMEPLANIKEVCMGVESSDTHLKLRGMELSLIDGYRLLNKEKGISSTIILQTPWAEQNKTYAVAGNVICLFFSPIGKPVSPPSNLPLAEYVRECWENENGDPFFFMDWPKML